MVMESGGTQVIKFTLNGQCGQENALFELLNSRLSFVSVDSSGSFGVALAVKDHSATTQHRPRNEISIGRPFINDVTPKGGGEGCKLL